MAVDWDKPIQCMSNGEWRPARYLGLMKVKYGRDDRLVAVDHGDWESVFWTSDSGCSDNARIVTNAPQRHVRWVNCYPPSSGPPDRGHETREQADKSACSSRIACIRIEFEEGEGLS